MFKVSIKTEGCMLLQIPFKRTRGENLADVVSRGVGLATEMGQEVSSDNLHFSVI